MEINRRFLPLKAHYCFFFGSMAPVLPFILVVAVQLGVPVPLQGSLSAFSLLFTVAGKPLVAALADIFPSYRKGFFLASISIMVLAFSSIKFIPTMQEPITVEGTFVRAIPISCINYDFTDDSQHFNTSQNTSASHPVAHGSTSKHCNFSTGISSADGSSNTEASSYSHPLFLATGDKRGRDIAIGLECSFICSSHWFCHSQNETTKDLNDFILKPISDPSGLQVMPRYGEVLQSDFILREQKTHSSSSVELQVHDGLENQWPGRLYQLTGTNISWNVLGTNASLRCAQGKWNTGRENQKHIWKSWQFWVLAVLLIIGQMAFNTAVSITDAIAVDTVGDGGAYGIQRAWGTIGWGVMAPVSGLLVDWWSGTSFVKDYTPAFLLCLIIGVADIALSSIFLKVPKLQDQGGILHSLWPLLKNPRFFIFCCFVVLNGCFDGIVVNYIFIMQEDMAKGTAAKNNMKFLQGLTVLVQGAVEAPFMFVYGWFMKKMGAQKVTSLVFFLYIFRLLGLYVAGQYGQVWTTLIPELLNGPCYGLGYTAIVVYAAKITPEGTSNTVQSAVNICYESFGYALAVFVGGFIYDQIGGPKMYLIAGGVAAITFILHIITLKIFPAPDECAVPGKPISSDQDLQSDDPDEIRALRSAENVST